MKKLAVAAIVLAALPAAALGQPDYDRGLERAAIEIVAAKVGTLRGAFDIDHKPSFVSPIMRETETSGLRVGEWREGLALATDRQGTGRGF